MNELPISGTTSNGFVMWDLSAERINDKPVTCGEVKTAESGQKILKGDESMTKHNSARSHKNVSEHDKNVSKNDQEETNHTVKITTNEGTKRTTDDVVVLSLPYGVRNISTKMCQSNSMMLSSHKTYAIAGVR